MTAVDPTTAWAARVDPRLQALVDRMKAGELGQDVLVAVFVRFLGAPEGLREHGLHVRSVSGGIATASLALADVPRAAQAAPVEYLQLGGGLRPGEES